jgi:hypothetical protein
LFAFLTTTELSRTKKTRTTRAGADPVLEIDVEGEKSL